MIKSSGRWATIALLALVACGGGGGPSALGEAGDPGAVDETIEISAEEFEFSVDAIDVTNDETIEFVVTNNGQTAHEFSLGGDHMHMGGDHMHGPATGSTGPIPPGEAMTFVWHFTKAGETVFACYIADHNKQGMTGTLTVGD